MAELSVNKTISKWSKSLPLGSEFSSRATQSTNWADGSQFSIVDFGISYFWNESNQLHSISLWSQDSEEKEKENKTKINAIKGKKSWQFAFKTSDKVTNAVKALYVSQIARYSVDNAVNPRNDEPMPFELTGELVDLFKSMADKPQIEFVQKALNEFSAKTFEVRRSKSFYYYNADARLVSTTKAQFVVVE